MLGNKQSGSIAAVGFDQYVKMLERAWSPSSPAGKPIHSEIRSRADPVETPGSSSRTTTCPIPASASSCTSWLSAIEGDDEFAADVMTEIADRYGALPSDVILLGELMGVKSCWRGKLGRDRARAVGARARGDRGARRHRLAAALASRLAPAPGRPRLATSPPPGR